MPYRPEQIKERYDRLPADIKEAIDSVSTTNTIVDIGQKHDLMYDQISELVDEIGLVMVGLTPSAMFVNNIARRMQVDIGTAMLVAKDINKQIFDKMRDSLKRIEEEHGESTEGWSDESRNVPPEKPKPEPVSEKTLEIDAMKAQKASVVSAVEKAGGFTIDKQQEDAPLHAEEMVNNAMKAGFRPKKAAINVLEADDFVPSPANIKLESSMPPDRLLGDVPETRRAVPAPESAVKADKATTDSAPLSEPKPIDQTSIVDTLLSKGIAMVIGDVPEKQAPVPEAPKVRPYDGTDPYREPTE